MQNVYAQAVADAGRFHCTQRHAAHGFVQRSTYDHSSEKGARCYSLVVPEQLATARTGLNLQTKGLTSFQAYRGGLLDREESDTATTDVPLLEEVDGVIAQHKLRIELNRWRVANRVRTMLKGVSARP